MRLTEGARSDFTFEYSSIFWTLTLLIRKLCMTRSNQLLQYHLWIFDSVWHVHWNLIGTFSNRIKAIPTSRPSKRSKGKIAVVVDYLPQFAATRPRCAYCSLIKLENRTFIQCMKCNIPLCLQKERNCFYEHHIQQ